MPWIHLTLSHIKSRLSEVEIDAYEEVGRSDGDEASRVTGPSGIIYQITQLIRSKVSSCTENVLGEEGTIPDECIHAAVSIARHNITSTPGGDGGERDRDDEYRDAMNFLRDIARCDVKIVNPSGEVATKSGGCFGGQPLREF